MRVHTQSADLGADIRDYPDLTDLAAILAARLKGGWRCCVESLDGLGESENLAVHEAHVELVEVEQLRPPRVPCLQQVSGKGTQRESAEPGRVARRALAKVGREGGGGPHAGHGIIRPAAPVDRGDCGKVRGLLGVGDRKSTRLNSSHANISY